ncbi:hypothetical protein [Fusobacterium necrogenes]|uniref:hypothetical protein n=1 Tax=Fusobacterium necrogenes TaxID=858 RepID=UPI00255D1268|nr:hypothetical protein [Fusobacterium necrogenes]
MRKIISVGIFLLSALLALGTDITSDNSNTDSGIINKNPIIDEGGYNPFPPDFIFPEGEIPEIPAGPTVPTTGRDVDELGQVRILEKTYTVMLESKVNIFVPLEVITDIDIETTVIGDQIVDVPFEIELNRKPEKENYYSIRYSENIIDIDADGTPDTYIFSPKYINEKVSKDNFVRIYGENITKEGTHKKDIYITVEIGG